MPNFNQRSRSGLSFSDIDRLRLIARGKQGVRKGYISPSPANTTGGLAVYDLRGPAMRMLPPLTPMRNRIPRASAPRGTTGMHWKAITAINTGKILPGVSEGNRNAPIAQTTADYFQSYAGLGMENFSTDEAHYAIDGNGIVGDIDVLTRLDALESLMAGEERVIVGGNQSLAFGTAPTPAGSIVATGGALTAQAWVCRVVALTLEGRFLASVPNGVATSFSRTNADGSVDTIHGGSSMISAESPAVTSAGANSILWKWASVPGAAAYAVYLGLAGATRLAAISDTNEYVQKANPVPATQLATAITEDNSQNPLVFDGVITQIVKGGISLSANGNALTLNNAGTFDELDEVFAKMSTDSRMSVTSLMVNPLTRKRLSDAVFAAGGVSSPKIQVTVNLGAGGVTSGITVDAIMNPYTGGFIPFENVVDLPGGMIVGWSDRIPYAIPGMGRMIYIETRQEYYSINWPKRTRKNEFGVYVDEGLIVKAPFAFFVIQDVG